MQAGGGHEGERERVSERRTSARENRTLYSQSFSRICKEKKNQKSEKSNLDLGISRRSVDAQSLLTYTISPIE